MVRIFKIYLVPYENRVRPVDFTLLTAAKTFVVSLFPSSLKTVLCTESLSETVLKL